MTLPDGSFRMSGLAAKPYNVCAGNELAGYAVRSGVSPGAADVTFTLRPGGRVRLTVKGPDGAPVKDAWPSVTKIGGSAVSVPWMGGRGPTDAAGMAEVPTPAGAVQIEVSKDKDEGKVQLNVAEGATVNAEITLSEHVEKSN